jgi:hypothetical protein
MPSPRPTLTYSTLQPGKPVYSARTDRLPGVEIDIPPQTDRWSAAWPPRTAGAWLAVAFGIVGAVAPLAGIAWWGYRSRNPEALMMLLGGGFVELLLLGGIAWYVVESARRRTTLRAGPDGLTIATLGGTAWPGQRHFPRAELEDVILNPAGYESGGQVVLLLNRDGDFYQGVDGTMLLPRSQAAEIADRIREAIGMPPRKADAGDRPLAEWFNHRHA